MLIRLEGVIEMSFFSSLEYVGMFFLVILIWPSNDICFK